MRLALVLVLVLLLAGCAPASVAASWLQLERIENEVRASSDELEVLWRFDAGEERLWMRYQGGGRALEMDLVEVVPSLRRVPHGEIGDGIQILTLPSDVPPKWFEDRDWAEPLRDVLALHAQVTARMAETWPSFYAAALAQPDVRLDEQAPLGQTCSASVPCPASAPTCVNEDPSQPLGYCSRACWGDEDCASDIGIGRCSIDVDNVPLVSESVRMCLVLCGEGGACPGSLTCTGDFGTGSAFACFP